MNTEGKIAEKKKHPGVCQPGAGVMTSGMEGQGQPRLALPNYSCLLYVQ